MEVIMPALSEYDVVIIGAGVVGCCAAREIARYDLHTVVLEAGADIACGATRANSGIVHTGYDPTPGSLKAYYNVRRAAMFPVLQQQLGFAYRKNGALVTAFSEDEVATLYELEQRARVNGAPGVHVIGQEKLRSLEPNVSPQAIAALYVPDSGICDPYGFALAMAENAADNGIEIAFNAQAAAITATPGAMRGGAGYAVVGDVSEEAAAITHDVQEENATAAGSYCEETADRSFASAGEKGAGCSRYEIMLADGTVVFARAVVNAAGVFSDVINNMVSATKLSIAPRRGEYHLYKEGIHAFGHTMFPVPGEAGKGVLVGVAAFGNQFIGPNAAPQESRTDTATTPEGLNEVMLKACRIWPEANEETVIANYVGIRATNAETGDFVVGPVAFAPGFFNAACIDSPGLTSSPAIGIDLAVWVAEYLDASKRTSSAFNPRRVPAPLLSTMDDKAKESRITRTRNLGLCYRIPGARCAGIFSAYGALCAMARTGYLPGQRVLVWGSLDAADKCAAELKRAGAVVMRAATGRILNVQGAGRVERVTIESEDGVEVAYACDALVVSEEMLDHVPVQ